MLYKNKNYVPMGFAYDYYVTEETYGQANKNSRANLLLSLIHIFGRKLCQQY